MSGERRCVVVRGAAHATAERALALLEALPGADVLWVSESAPERFVHARPNEVRGLLGRSFDAVVLDLHAGLDADVLGQCHGFVWGGGSLVLRMPIAAPEAGRERFAVYPHAPSEVGTRFWDRFERCLALAPTAAGEAAIAPAQHATHGTAEQAVVARRLAQRFGDPAPSFSVLLADRGRGKSAAMGLGLAGIDRALRVAVSAANESSCREVLRFAGGRARFVPLGALVRDGTAFDVIVVDEAARLPVPTLQRLVRRHPEARIAFASTVRGYEGTGRGFVLRFLEWLARQERPLERLTLEAPIRWAPQDPLERLVFDALLLDAEPGPVPTDITGAEHVVLDRDALAKDEALLRSFFGLLVHAHYRTTPGDLHRILDAPNLRLHALRHEGAVLAATLVAIEGDLPAGTCDRMHRGALRIRGHALPDTIISHLGRRDAGALRMVRSVRIAVHPALRRRGLGSALVAHVHQTYAPDLFGTLFGATPELLRFRRSVGYELVRVGASRGARTGEPAAVMVRPASDRARTLLGSMRAELARDLPLQLELLSSDGALALEPDLERALLFDLPEPSPLSAEDIAAAVDGYAFGPRTYESVALAITRFVDQRAAQLASLDDIARRLIVGRVRHRKPWSEVASEASLPSVPAAMRALRRAVRTLAEATRYA